MGVLNLDNQKPINFCEEYLREVEKTHTVQHEHGAMWYRFQGENDCECFITGVWIIPEHRKSGIASRLADMVFEIAKSKGCKYLIGQVDPKTPGASVSLLSQLHYGFQLSPNIVDGKIILFKEI